MTDLLAPYVLDPLELVSRFVIWPLIATAPEPVPRRPSSPPRTTPSAPPPG